MTVLTDIGGTYVRFAVAGNSGPEKIDKYAAEEFETLGKALEHYCKAQGIKFGGPLRIATAGYEDDGIWKFVNRNKWQINPAELEKQGWEIECILNDFEAATWALSDLKPGDIEVFKKGKPAQASKCLLGPGTGLGLGYLHHGEHPFVQKTHGGHMPVAALSDEQRLIIQTMQRLKTDETVPVFENVVSGPGLYNIYAACCLVSGKIRRVDTPENMLKETEDPEIVNSLRIFHEFFGLFAATAVITGHAYGGLHLTGGVLEHLVAQKVFDFEHFEKWFCLEAVDSVKQALQNTPIIYITEPYPALRGLLHA